jgi:hypothetical protein
MACHAVGISDVAPRTIVIAYAADAVVGAAPLLPGGIRLVEGAGCRSPLVAACVCRCHRRRSDLPRDQPCPRRCRVGWTLWLWTRYHGQPRSGCACRPDRHGEVVGATPHTCPRMAPPRSGQQLAKTGKAFRFVYRSGVLSRLRSRSVTAGNQAPQPSAHLGYVAWHIWSSSGFLAPSRWSSPADR